MTSEDEIRLQALEADVARLKARVKNNSSELGANSRGTLTFAGGVVLLLLLGSRFSHESGYSYVIELEKLTTLIGLPAVAAILAAVLPGLRK